MKKLGADEVARCREHGDVTPSGVAFNWGLAGPNGASFTLIREAHTTDDDIERAKAYLRAERDVVGSIRTLMGDTPPPKTYTDDPWKVTHQAAGVNGQTICTYIEAVANGIYKPYIARIDSLDAYGRKNSDETAERIVACVNACRGIPTTDLNDAQSQPRQTLTAFGRACTDRDRLLEAAKLALDCATRPGGDIKARAAEVIAKLEEAIAGTKVAA